MSLVTLHRSPVGSPSSSPVPQDEERPRRGRMQKRESFALVKGAVLYLPEGEEAQEVDNEEAPPPTLPRPQTKSSRAQHCHLQHMVALLRSEDRLKLAVRLESLRENHTRYLLIVSRASNEEENILLGVDISEGESVSCTIGLVLPVWSDTQVYLDGDGGFSVSSAGQTHIFKPSSVQTMW
ncbi:UNVERIFIED_CONTAM: hypothetical protein FKN15_048882 [Acipenser sinensis]